ncbi:MAG: hypothetical protein GYB51_23470 [Rhodobacteraceae bacterium]|uniref:Uncharacterized protein n=1 Tax=Celeribacter persicus TaxID=1651082 RepID=A0A2T5H5W7_9RHOB|nr:hypothetical protein [Celeribacter persicus]MBR9823952.1 hypothetical protein [Paracoccaceae bacterium]PTQ66971.1 hypothetical protein C8N42_1217 [Celeribacter persicus]
MKQATRQYGPLQPLAEQHCITTKLDALMALCDQPEANFTAITRSKLLDSALHEAMELAVKAVNA